MAKFNGMLGKFKKLDIFGIPVQLHFNKSPKFKSNFGAFLTLIVLTISFYFLINQIIGWFSLEIATTISSNETLSVSGMLNENRNISYILTNSNYSIYFAVYAILPDSTWLTHQELERYLTFSYEYSETGLFFK